MASCGSLTGVTYNRCDGSMGGIKNVYIGNYDGITASFSGTADEGNQVVTAISGTFESFHFRKNTGSMTSTLNISDEGGNYVSTELTLLFSRMDAEKRVAMNALMIDEFACVVEDCNSKLWYLGFTNPVEASAGDGQTGTAKTDANRYSITLTDDCTQFPPTLAENLYYDETSKGFKTKD